MTYSLTLLANAMLCLLLCGTALNGNYVNAQLVQPATESIGWQTVGRDLVAMMLRHRKAEMPLKVGHLHSISTETEIVFSAKAEDNNAGNAVVRMRCELIVLSRIEKGRMSAGLNGIPQDKAACAQLAIELCKATQQQAAAFEKWASNGKNLENDKGVGAGSTTKGRTTSIEVLRSFDDDKPWRVLLTISFPETEM